MNFFLFWVDFVGWIFLLRKIPKRTEKGLIGWMRQIGKPQVR